jgi:hypothetical protein
MRARALVSIPLAIRCTAGLLLGCASTKTELSGTVPDEPGCQRPGESLSALVLWGTNWRANQKEVALREEAARQGLESFFTTSDCFATVETRRLPSEASALTPTDQALLSVASAANPRPARLVLVTVRGLGPVVKVFGATALVEGGTEVVLELRVLDAGSGASLASFRTHWQNGGAMVIKGVSSLPQDMHAALYVALQPRPLPK